MILEPDKSPLLHTIDISFKNTPKLSNFYPHRFFLDGIECASMEGFLQSLKFEDLKVQELVCKMVGYAAKKFGAKQNWNFHLYWRGWKYLRTGEDYQNLLDKAFFQLSKVPEFQDALLETENKPLTHSIGKSYPYATVLTEEEFCSRLMKIRKELQGD